MAQQHLESVGARKLIKDRPSDFSHSSPLPSPHGPPALSLAAYRRRRRGNGEGKSTSLTRTASNRDLSAVRVDDAFRDRKPQPRATRARSARRLPVPIEKPSLILQWNPWPGILH